MSQLEAERDDLCAKIQAGEGETALLNQLKEKNQALQGQVEKFPLMSQTSAISTVLVA